MVRKFLSTLVLSYGYHHAHDDHNLFIKAHKFKFNVFIVYVDDIVLIGIFVQGITNIKHNFHIKDLDTLKYFMRIKVTPFKQDISLCQYKNCLNLLKTDG